MGDGRAPLRRETEAEGGETEGRRVHLVQGLSDSI